MTPLKHTVARWISRLGYTVVPNWRLASFVQADFLARLFALAGVDLVLDVGANRGQYHDFLRHDVGYDGFIASFEPLPALSRHLLERSANDDRWIVYSCALGRERGTAPFNVMDMDTFSSFLSPTASATHRFEQMNSVRSTVDVPVRTLDDVVDDLRAKVSFRRPYLKLDTQGYDLAVIEGAANFLPDIVALQTEASVTPIYEGSPDFATAIRMLERRGFALSGIFPNNPGHFPRMFEFDCHMVNEARVPEGIDKANVAASRVMETR
jgi:FkbM family methyltransferase